MSVKLLHTAEWQIGMNAARTGAASPQVREARFAAARRLADLAREERVDFAVLAGDTFEHPGISLAEVERTAEILADFGCPVYVLPGNHDPLEPGGVWDRPVWRAYANVFVLRRAEVVEAGEAVLFACPLRNRWSGEDPTAWIPSGAHADRIRIGIAHGTLEGIPSAERAHPIPADAAWARRLDYLALGDWHSQRVFRGADGAERMAYSGTPEPTGFGEDASGRALIVEIDEPRAAPRVRSVETARLRWIQRRFEIIHAGQLAEAKSEIESLQGGHVLLEAHLTGTLLPEEAAVLESLRGMEAGFLYLQIDGTGLAPAIELEKIEIRDPIVRAALRRLEEKGREGPEARAARLAVQTLLRLAKGVGA
jgi:DNA repair exonuclease SbcCD nuclease subunit